MQLAFGSRHVSIVARGLQGSRASCVRTRPSQLLGLGFPGGLRRTHGLSGYHLWRQGLKPGDTSSGVLGLESGRRYILLPRDDDPLRQQTKPKQEERHGTETGTHGLNKPAEQKDEIGERRGSASRGPSGRGPQKGKLLTTPSRLLKLLIPLPTNHPKEVETIAILVHSQQPLSYLERLIQAELPAVKGSDGLKRSPGVSFVAFQLENHPIRPSKARNGKKATADPDEEMEIQEAAVADDKGQGHPEEKRPPKSELDKYSSLAEAQPKHEDAEQRYVRWSHATEIGDFIRDAARTGEFIVAIEGAPPGLDRVRVAVPSFNERTHFLRMRLRKISSRIRSIADVKHECDRLAHRGAQRVALGGFGILATWWVLVYKLTFDTDLGWDTMEPVTYLVSLSTLMGGYLWFLYHNREISYRSALDFTINARQKKLYQLKGVDLQLWENLTYEANALRREIKTIAAEYDTEWDERLDEQGEDVAEVLRKERDQKKDKDDLDDKGDSDD
ncbi:hypothetical protein BJX61DRAFT_538350 [Aspergillus egyptiacus]|nr:hypothetical protein BJX61DRAFT_538350 [Aspergillus egyptiacus]